MAGFVCAVSMALSLEGLAAMLPRRARGYVNMALAAVQEFLLMLMQSRPQTYVHVDIQDGAKRSWVEAKTLGRKGA